MRLHTPPGVIAVPTLVLPGCPGDTDVVSDVNPPARRRLLSLYLRSGFLTEGVLSVSSGVSLGDDGMPGLWGGCASPSHIRPH